MNRPYKLNTAPYGTHRVIADAIGNNHKIVLDIGCNKGYLSRLAPANIFYGIDCNASDLEIAATSYKKTYQIDLNRDHSDFKLDLKFDVIVCGDILEHLMYPEDVLRFFVKQFLKDDGIVIISLPNVANLSVRIQLFFGNFNYTDAGILDRTHFHLFTLKTGRELIKACGLNVVEERVSSDNFGKFIKSLPFLSGLLGHNLIFICKKRY